MRFHLTVVILFKNLIFFLALNGAQVVVVGGGKTEQTPFKFMKLRACICIMKDMVVFNN
jgi:siroheme synthase (precorrin-2 oxidase/ferrochelatase)